MYSLALRDALIQKRWDLIRRLKGRTYKTGSTLPPHESPFPEKLPAPYRNDKSPDAIGPNVHIKTREPIH